MSLYYCTVPFNPCGVKATWKVYAGDHKIIISMKYWECDVHVNLFWFCQFFVLTLDMGGNKLSDLQRMYAFHYFLSMQDILSLLVLHEFSFTFRIMGENSLFNCDLFKWFNNRLVNSNMEGKKVTQFTWIWNLKYKFQLETLKIQILYKKKRNRYFNNLQA